MATLSSWSTNVAYSFATASGLPHERALELWSTLLSAIEKIYAGDTSELRYEELYRHAYTLTAHKYGDMVYSGVVKTFAKRIADIKRVLSACSPAKFVETVVESWESYSVAAALIRDILVYLDHSFVKTTGKAPIYVAALETFYAGILRDHVFAPFFRSNIITLVQQARDSFTAPAASAAAALTPGSDVGTVVVPIGATGAGSASRRDLIRRCVALYVAIAPTLAVYRSEFEAELAAASRAYYDNYRRTLLASALASTPFSSSSSSLSSSSSSLSGGGGMSMVDDLTPASPEALARAVPIYLRAIEACLLADDELIRDVCHCTSTPVIRAVVQDSLITHALPVILGTSSSSSAAADAAAAAASSVGAGAGAGSGVGALPLLIRTADLPTLARLYRICSREGGALTQLGAMVGLEVRAAGEGIVEAAAAQQNPAQFVEQLLRLQEHYARIITSAFKSDRNLLRLLKAGLERVLISCKESPIYLSLYIDAIFRLVGGRSSRLPGSSPGSASTGPGSTAGGGMPEACLPQTLARQMIFADALPKELTQSQLEHRICGILFVFRHLNDKDAFEDAFRKHLAGRLLTVGVDVGLERSLLHRLSNESMHQFTAHFEGMLKDIQISQEVSGQFNKSLHAATATARTSPGDLARLRTATPALVDAATTVGAGELNATVLTASFWPLQRLDCCRLPPQAAVLANAFMENYLKTRKARKLQWQAQLGTAIVSCTFHSGTKDLLVPSYQMVILLQYTPRNNVYTYAQLLKATEMPELELRRHLLSLAHPRVGILVKSPNTTKLSASDTYTFNLDFVSPGPRFVVPVLGLAAVERMGVPAGLNDAPGEGGAQAGAAAAADSKAQAESRKHQVDAAIVRVMKRTKTMLHNDLVTHVTGTLASSFSVDTALIKARIEVMLEQDYLERDAGDRSRYNYLA